MPCLPSTSISRTGLPFEASARARAAATVVLPVPPFPVTTCSRTPSQSVSRTLTWLRLSAPAAGTVPCPAPPPPLGCRGACDAVPCPARHRGVSGPGRSIANLKTYLVLAKRAGPRFYEVSPGFDGFHQVLDNWAEGCR